MCPFGASVLKKHEMLSRSTDKIFETGHLPWVLCFINMGPRLREDDYKALTSMAIFLWRAVLSRDLLF